jgi:hypothetical protein
MMDDLIFELLLQSAALACVACGVFAAILGIIYWISKKKAK